MKRYRLSRHVRASAMAPGADTVLELPARSLIPATTNHKRRPNPTRKPRPAWVADLESGELGVLEPWDGYQGFVVRTVLLRAREYAKSSKKPPRIACSNDVVQICRWLLTQPQEHVCTLLLNGQNALAALHDTTAGTMSTSQISADMMARVALLVGSRAVIMVHNHPSGDPSPSKADAEMTVKVSEYLACHQIQLVDHVVIGVNGHFSFLEAGLIQSPK